MNAALKALLTWPFLIILIFQPYISEIRVLRSYFAEMVLDAAIEKAASGENGRFTPAIINELKDQLVDTLGYDYSDIQFTGTTELKDRGEYIEATLIIPHDRLWILPNFFAKDSFDPYIVKHASQMSEYIIQYNYN